jgi:hypothetical protein
LHIQANQNLCTGNAPATLLSEAVGHTLLAHLVPGMSQKNFLVVQCTSLIISLWSAVTKSCALLPFRWDTHYLLWLCAYCL